jgi:hypothetical protein
LSADSDKEGAQQKALGPAAKRRERRKRSLTRERASASDEPGAESVATTEGKLVSATLPAASMNARLAEIARLKQQRMVESNDAIPVRAANNQAYRAIGGGSTIARRPQKQEDATIVTKEVKEEEEEEGAGQLTPFLRALQTYVDFIMLFVRHDSADLLRPTGAHWPRASLRAAWRSARQAKSASRPTSTQVSRSSKGALFGPGTPRSTNDGGGRGRRQEWLYH